MSTEVAPGAENSIGARSVRMMRMQQPISRPWRAVKERIAAVPPTSERAATPCLVDAGCC